MYVSLSVNLTLIFLTDLKLKVLVKMARISRPPCHHATALCRGLAGEQALPTHKKVDSVLRTLKNFVKIGDSLGS